MHDAVCLLGLVLLHPVAAPRQHVQLRVFRNLFQVVHRRGTQRSVLLAPKHQDRDPDAAAHEAPHAVVRERRHVTQQSAVVVDRRVRGARPLDGLL
eukprot:353522-Chlamydomonas_euryale.AAC.17